MLVHSHADTDYYDYVDASIGRISLEAAMRRYDAFDFDAMLRAHRADTLRVAVTPRHSLPLVARRPHFVQHAACFRASTAIYIFRRLMPPTFLISAISVSFRSF